MRHLTNGDLAAAVIRRVAPGEVIPWRDVLHEGPVRAGLTLDELSTERAAFITEAGWGRASFADRDAALRSLVAEDEVVLWFEHDLYDQLQIAQILARLAELRVPAERITLICIGEHLGIAHFGGLGELRPDQLEALPAAAA